MFTINIAGIPIAIDNHFGLVEYMCKPYVTNEKPFFVVSVSAEDMLQESDSISAYAESLCIYRKIASKMLEYGAFLMHAAVIDVDGQGLAFAAASGIGKTTRLLLWQKAMGNRVKIINGDKPILRFIDDTFYAFGTPWMGKENYGENSFVPLNYVCFLERSDNVSLNRLNSSDIVPRLFKQILIPKDQQQLHQFMDLVQQFVEKTQFFILKCNKDIEQPELIWEEMRNLKTIIQQ